MMIDIHTFFLVSCFISTTIAWIPLRPYSTLFSSTTVHPSDYYHHLQYDHVEGDCCFGRHPSPRKHQQQRRRPHSLHVSRMDSVHDQMECSTLDDTSIEERPPLSPPHTATTTSLAGDFVIVTSSSNLPSDDDGIDLPTWSFFPIQSLFDNDDHESMSSDGAQSTQALTEVIRLTTTTRSPAAVLSCRRSVQDGILDIQLSSDTNVVNEKLMDVMQRIFVQWVVSETNFVREGGRSSSWTISFYQDDVKDMVVDFSSESSTLRSLLFDGLIESPNTVEWVEMVTGTRKVLGQLPRRLVHTFNILHRGIGLFVTKDTTILDSLKDYQHEGLPDLYVHRRSSTKRIFPSLYDMFVGGVSMSEESPELTARREVAEELGLHRALEDDDALSHPLLDCIVCTSYNRCVVTLFSYTMKTEEETVQWQEEEVDWGRFIPYDVIVAAADRSIDRLASKKEWPGTYPPIQSTMNGSLPSGSTFEYSDWKEWDFVPDGLLVWEAWLQFMAKDTIMKTES